MAPETLKLHRVPSNCEGEDEITTDKVNWTGGHDHDESISG